MTRTPTTANRPSTLIKSSHRIHRVQQQRPRESLRRSSNIFFRRDSFADSDDDDESGHVALPSPDKKPRPSYAWDNEETLVSALLLDDNPNTADHNSKFSMLADSLQDSFNRNGATVLQDMVHTLQPAVQRIQHVHRTLERHVDPTFATGLLAFDDACKAFESLNIDEHRALQREFAATKERITDLFGQLEDAYRHREKLWSNLDAVIAAKMDPAIAALAELPATTERTIATLEKHAKSLAAKEDDGSAADKIRNMLAKLT